MPGGQEELRAAIMAYLAERHSLTLATNGPPGPWAAGLYFASDGLRMPRLSFKKPCAWIRRMRRRTFDMAESWRLKAAQPARWRIFRRRFPT